MQKEHGVAFRWTVFPLHPETPEAGLELAELFAGRGYDLAGMQRRLSEVASEIGLPITPRSRSYSSRRAQELGKLAEKLGLVDAYRRRVYRAHFVEGKNIGGAEELVKIAAEAGLPEAGARASLEERSFAKEVDDDWRRARLLGITGVPAFLCERRLLIGFRPYQDLVSLVKGE